jgi:hypothetical protein
MEEIECMEIFKIKIKGKRGTPGATGATGATGPASIPVGNTIFVDSVFGDDTKIEFQNQIKPAKTIFVAYNIAANKATPDNPVQVIVRPGTYPEPNTIMLANNVILTGAGRNVTIVRGNFDGSNVTGLSIVTDINVVSAGKVAVTHTGDGVVVFRRTLFNISNVRFGFIQRNGNLQLLEINVIYSNDTFNNNTTPAVFFIGNSSNGINFVLDRSNIQANFGDSTDPLNRDTTSSLLPSIIRSHNPSSFVPGRNFAVQVTPTYNNYTVLSNGPSVVYTRYLVIVDLPNGISTTQGFRQSIRASNENHFVNILTTLDPALSQVTIAGIEVNSDTTGDNPSAVVTINGIQWDLTDVNDDFIPRSFAYDVITGPGNSPVDCLIDKNSVVGTNQSIPPTFSNASLLLLADNRMDGNRLKTIPEKPNANTNVTGTSNSTNQKAGVNAKRAALDINGSQDIVLQPGRRGQISTHYISPDSGGINYLLGSFQATGNELSYKIVNQSDAQSTIRVNPPDVLDGVVGGVRLLQPATITKFTSTGRLGNSTAWNSFQLKP